MYIINLSKWIGPILLGSSSVIWGGMFVIVKIVVAYIPPIELVWLRYLIAIVILIIISLLKKEQWHIDKKDLGLIFLIGLIGDTVSIVAQETGTWLANAQLGSVVTSSTPTFMIIFAWLLLKERLTKAKILSVILASIGVLLIVGIHLSGKHTLWGIILLIVAALTWALMSVLIKKLSGYYSILQITIMTALVAIICLSPIVMSRWPIFTQIDFSNPVIIFGLFCIGVVSTALAFIMWNMGLKRTSASVAGLFYVIQPVTGTLLGWLFLNEKLSWGFLMGTFLIVGSVWIAIRFER